MNARSIVSTVQSLILLISIPVAFLSDTIIACPQTEGNPLAIIPPFLDRQHRDDWENTLQLARQEFIVFLYRDAAVVYSEADFVNTGLETLRVELGLPSTGYSAGGGSGELDVSSGVRGVRLWVARGQVEPELHHDGGVDWLTVAAIFKPQVQTAVKALFWMETSVAGDAGPVNGVGDRAIEIPLSLAAMWKDVINSVDVTVVLKEGLTAGDSLFEADPDNYSIEDSVLTWSFRNFEPSSGEDISILYSLPQAHIIDVRARENLSRYIIDHAYDEMLEYVRDSEEE